MAQVIFTDPGTGVERLVETHLSLVEAEYRRDDLNSKAQEIAGFEPYSMVGDDYHPNSHAHL